jgi:hypothetical protein
MPERTLGTEGRNASAPRLGCPAGISRGIFARRKRFCWSGNPGIIRAERIPRDEGQEFAQGAEAEERNGRSPARTEGIPSE